MQLIIEKVVFLNKKRSRESIYDILRVCIPQFQPRQLKRSDEARMRHKNGVVELFVSSRIYRCFLKAFYIHLSALMRSVSITHVQNSSVVSVKTKLRGS